MKVLVTGGGGFLGAAIVRRLAQRGDAVRSFSRGDYPALRGLGVELLQGDLADRAAVARACEGCDLVFHVAAKPGVWGPWADYYRPNVLGTQAVVQACLSLEIPRLVYTSSPSVVFDGRDVENGGPSIPYPTAYEAHYPKTKAMAERIVLGANGEGLATVALRPHLIWGPGDNHLVPRILARASKLRIIGPGTNRVDAVYVENAADAHILAADRLAPGSPIAGRAYFITNADPRPAWEIVNAILAAGGRPPIVRHIPVAAAVAVGWTLERIHSAFGIESEPRLTRFVAHELSSTHWFDPEPARRELGYEPRVGMEEGMERLAEWLRATGQALRP